jgi:hypothetical protein
MQMQIPHAEAGQICPLHKQDVSEVCHTCPWFTRVIGKHPQKDEMVDNWHCAIAVLPTLLVENAMVGRQTGAAVETLRNVTHEVGRIIADGPALMIGHNGRH